MLAPVKKIATFFFLMFKILAAAFFLFLTLIILWFLFVFSQPHSQPQYINTACIASPGFTCIAITVNSTGKASLTFIQNYGAMFYDTALSCYGAPFLVTNTSNTGSPQNGGLATFYAIGENGAMAGLNATRGMTIGSGSQVHISGLQCFSATNLTPLNNLAVGSTFQGYIWIGYTSSNKSLTSQHGSNPMLLEKMFTVTIKVIR